MLLAFREALIDFGELLRKCVCARAEPSQFRIHGLQLHQALDLWLHPQAILAQPPLRLTRGMAAGDESTCPAGSRLDSELDM